MVKFVLLDLDNTLLNFSVAEKNALTKALIQSGIDVTDDILSRYSVINAAQWRMLEDGLLTRDQVKVRRYELLFKEFNIDYSPKKTAKAYEGFLAQGYCYMEGAKELLEALYKKYDLYIVTNGTKVVQTGRMRSADMEKYFKGIFISEDIGYDKPSREYFNRCFELIPNFDKKQAVIIGDSLTSDIRGGQNSGITTIWFNPNHQENPSELGVKPNYEIKSLSQIEELLNDLNSSL